MIGPGSDKNELWWSAIFLCEWKDSHEVEEYFFSLIVIAIRWFTLGHFDLNKGVWADYLGFSLNHKTIEFAFYSTPFTKWVGSTRGNFVWRNTNAHQGLSLVRAACPFFLEMRLFQSMCFPSSVCEQITLNKWLTTFVKTELQLFDVCLAGSKTYYSMTSTLGNKSSNYSFDFTPYKSDICLLFTHI